MEYNTETVTTHYDSASTKSKAYKKQNVTPFHVQ